MIEEYFGLRDAHSDHLRREAHDKRCDDQSEYGPTHVRHEYTRKLYKCYRCLDTGYSFEPFIDDKMIPYDDHRARVAYGRGTEGEMRKVDCECPEELAI